MATLEQRLKDEARRLGFDLVGIAPATSPPTAPFFHEWLGQGRAGAMAYLQKHAQAHDHPESILPGVRSVVMLGMNYGPNPEQAGDPGRLTGRVASYALGRDYHEVIWEKLNTLLAWVRVEVPGCQGRGVVDTAPLLERDFARLAGLGWFGKNTMLINKRLGSYFFLGALLLDVPLTADQPFASNHCGTCTACLDACPTDAFVGPYQLDARKCISYLTIELRGDVPEELRAGMGDWIFGCDVCQDVCPWNRKAPPPGEPAFQPLAELRPPDLMALLRLTQEEFRERFRHSPLRRPRRGGLLRNVAIALGNLGDRRAIPALIEALSDPEPVVRRAAAWALGQLGHAAPEEPS